MERLTERFSNGQAAVYGCGNNCKWDYKYCHNHYEDCPTINEIYEKLAKYEDAEEQGLLLQLPCKIGDTVWCIFVNQIYEGKVKSFNCCHCEYDGDYINIDVAYEIIYPFNNDGRLMHRCDPKRYGERVFLTKEEAERALEEMQKG